MHGVFFPHFRDQINCVPGITTEVHFTATITTDSMKMITKDSNFYYLLICNRVCGPGHYTMAQHVVVDSPDEYKAWLAKQHPYYERKTQGKLTASK